MMLKAIENILNTIIEGNKGDYMLYLHFSNVGIIYDLAKTLGLSKPTKIRKT